MGPARAGPVPLQRVKTFSHPPDALAAPTRATSSEAQPHRQLCLPCCVSACDQPCGHQGIFDIGQSAIHNPVRNSEIHPIQDIEHFDAEFSAHRSAEGNHLHE